MLLLTLAGVLAALAPSLRSLPRAAAITGAVLVAALVQMAFDLPPDLVLLEAVVCLVGLKVLSMKEALDGFRSEGVVTVGVMCAVAKSIQVTGGLQLIAKYLLGAPRGCASAPSRQPSRTPRSGERFDTRMLRAWPWQMRRPCCA